MSLAFSPADGELSESHPKWRILNRSTLRKQSQNQVRHRVYVDRHLTVLCKGPGGRRQVPSCAQNNLGEKSTGTRNVQLYFQVKQVRKSIGIWIGTGLKNKQTIKCSLLSPLCTENRIISAEFNKFTAHSRR